MTITVEAPNTPPVAIDDVETVSDWGTVTIAPLDNDYDVDFDPLTVIGAFGATNGWVMTDGATVTYTHNPGAGGTYDTFSYTISDGRGGTDTASAAVVIAGAPVGSGPCVLGGTAWDDLTPDGAMANAFYEPRTAGVAVALLNAGGGWVAGTKTDSQGGYAFGGLPYGTYSVQFTAPSGKLFTIQDAAGVTEDVDSDARQSGGQTDPVALTPGRPGYGLLGAGFVAAPAEPPLVVITDYTTAMVTDANGLKVAKWKDAFEVNEFTGVVQVKGPDATTKYDFIDRDPDRFNMWVYDKAAWDAKDGNNDPLNTHVTVRISTKNLLLFTSYNDAPTAVDLVRYSGPFPGKATGWFWSDSQMLMANTVDDAYSNSNYLAVDETQPVAGVNSVGPKNGYIWRLSDRTHKVALDGRVKAEYTNSGGVTVSATAPVKVVKTVKLGIHDLRDKPKAQGGVLAAPHADIVTHITRLKEVFAQIGISVRAEIYEQDPPGNVTLTNGLEFDRSVVIEDEVKKLLADSPLAYRSTAGATGRPVIEVYYVNYRSDLTGAEDLGAPNGQAFVRKGVWDMKYSDSVILQTGKGADFPHPLQYMVLAHEVGHIFENLVPGSQDSTHYPYIDPLPASPSLVDTVNLMVKGGRTIAVDEVKDSRRLTIEQQGRMQGWSPG